MTTSMYYLYVGFGYTNIDINALAQMIKSCLAMTSYELKEHYLSSCVLTLASGHEMSTLTGPNQ